MANIGIREGMLASSGPEFLLEAKVLGFDSVELDVGGHNRADPWGGTQGRAEMRAAAERAGIAIPSVCLGCLNGIPLAGADPAKRAEAAALVRNAMAWTREVGAGFILIPFFGPAEMKSEADHERLVEEIRKLAPQAQERGLGLGIESTLHARTLIPLLERIGAPNAGSYWDTGNSIWRGYDPVEEIGLLGRHILRVHLKDTFKNPSDRMLGEGRVPFPRVALALQRIGYRGPLILETPTQPDPAANARKNLAFARGIFEAQAALASA